MAPVAERKKRKKKSVSGWFREVFLERPDWLEGKSNTELRERWLAEHPSHREMPQKVQQAMANVKSVMRRQLREEGEGDARRKVSVKKKAIELDSSTNPLETLEICIDECLILAWNTDREGLQHVIRLLRKARDEVVLKSGE